MLQEGDSSNSDSKSVDRALLATVVFWVVILPLILFHGLSDSSKPARRRFSQSRTDIEERILTSDLRMQLSSHFDIGLRHVPTSPILDKVLQGIRPPRACFRPRLRVQPFIGNPDAVIMFMVSVGLTQSLLRNLNLFCGEHD